MDRVKPGDKAVDFCLQDENEINVCLKDFSGQWVVLYFYPKDNTSGCTLEAVDFSQKLGEFKKRKAVIMGVSPDSPKSHCGFRDKNDLKIKLLSDSDHQVIEKYGAWVLKKMYGREYFGVERSTFLIDPEGMIRSVWRKVNVKDHVNDVLQKLIEHQNG